MTSDADCVEANVDYGNVSGYVVRLDVQIPRDAVNGHREDGGPVGMLLFTHDEAEALGQELLTRAEEVRRLREDGRRGHGPVQT